ncbi:MAG: PAQR family membrane homeostasis protein TrhA [Promethearchaeota archaeon]
MTHSIDFENDLEKGNSKKTSLVSIQKKFIKRPEERFSVYSHLIGAILSIIGTIVLIIVNLGNPIKVIVSLIYGIAVTLLFFASAICHSLKTSEDHIFFWTRIDQIAIFFMIAGTYTPIAYVYLNGSWRIGILIGQWVIVGAGLILKLVWINSPRWITAGIYLLQGWMAIIPGYIIFLAMPRLDFILAVIAGFTYSIGALMYILRKPKLFPGVFGSHDLFHVCVLLGNALFYIVIFRAL